jgi:hypothetical protein
MKSWCGAVQIFASYDRLVLSAIMHVLKVGCRWVDCPKAYGPHKTICNRFARWSERGIWPSSATTTEAPHGRENRRGRIPLAKLLAISPEAGLSQSSASTTALRSPLRPRRLAPRAHRSGRSSRPASRSVAPASHQLFIICRARFRRSFDEMPSPTSLAR